MRAFDIRFILEEDFRFYADKKSTCQRIFTHRNGQIHDQSEKTVNTRKFMCQIDDVMCVHVAQQKINKWANKMLTSRRVVVDFVIFFFFVVVGFQLKNSCAAYL